MHTQVSNTFDFKLIGIQKQFSHKGYLFCQCTKYLWLLMSDRVRIALFWWNENVDMLISLTKIKKKTLFLNWFHNIFEIWIRFLFCVFIIYIPTYKHILYLHNITFYIFPHNCYFLIWIQHNQLTAFFWTYFLGCMTWFIFQVKRKTPYSKSYKFIFANCISYKVD